MVQVGTLLIRAMKHLGPGTHEARNIHHLLWYPSILCKEVLAIRIDEVEYEICRVELICKDEVVTVLEMEVINEAVLMAFRVSGGDVEVEYKAYE